MRGSWGARKSIHVLLALFVCAAATAPAGAAVQWNQEAKILASDGSDADRFGSDVDISGNYAIVGAVRADAAYIFERVGNNWTEVAKLTGSDVGANDDFGAHVAIHGDYAVVGAPSQSSSRGAAYVYWKGSGWTTQAEDWKLPQPATLDLSPQDYFGTVDIHGDRIIVGAYGKDDAGPSDAGAAYVFRRDAGGWPLEATLYEETPESSGHYGVSVAISLSYIDSGASTRAVVGSTGAELAEVWVRDFQTWSRETQLLPTGGITGDKFGAAVGISGDGVNGDYAAVGAPDRDGSSASEGAVYVYHRPDGSTTWTQQTMIPGTTSSQLGYYKGVHVGASVLVAGAPHTNVNTGAVRTFHLVGSTWTEDVNSPVTAPDGQQWDYFGWSAAVYANRFIAGAYLDDNDLGNDAGSAYIFVYSEFTSTTSGVLPYGIPETLKIEKVLDNTADLGDIVQSPTNEIWVLERTTGTIRVLVLGVQDVSLTIPASSACESGLLDVAFAPDYRSSGLALVYYVDETGKARVDRVYRSPSGLTLGGKILDLGTTPTGCRPGGGLEIGPSGLLYVSVGDLGNSSDAQDEGQLPGKVLRSELDGSVPIANTSGTLVFALGFRHGTDLALDPVTAQTDGTLYLTDVGESTSVYDESNAVLEGYNYGWDDGSGPGYGTDPLDSAYSMGAEAVEDLSSDALGLGADDSIVYACDIEDDIRQAYLTGADRDVFRVGRIFYDPDGDRDGTPDAGCPRELNALFEGGEGWLYAGNSEANPGIWRIWADGPGPREVSPPASPFYLTVGKVAGGGDELEIGWERLGALDVGLPPRNFGQHVADYQVWEGMIGTWYSHGVIAGTAGVPYGTAYLKDHIQPHAGNTYYLVSAQNDNMEGSLGAGRPSTPDYCTGFRGIQVGDCAEDWAHPVTATEHCLVDKNPNSETFDHCLAMSDFRGRVVRMDLCSEDALWCSVQSDYLPAVDLQYRDRDLVIVTVLTESFTGAGPFDTLEECATAAAAWAGSSGQETPILCDTDLDGDNHGDVSWQYWDAACGGVPQNYYVDQGHTIYQFVCGAELNSATINAQVAAEVNPETCE
jgi:hypothetical protein